MKSSVLSVVWERGLKEIDKEYIDKNIYIFNVLETLLLVSAWIRLIKQTSLKQTYLRLMRKSLCTAGLDKLFAHLNYPSITPNHHLCLMRVTGMLQPLPVLSGKGRNTL